MSNRGGQYRKAGRGCQPALHDWVDGLLAWLFPWRCHLCGGAASGFDLCAGCLDDLPWLDAPSDGPETGALTALAYEFPVDRLVAALKFRRRTAVGRLLGELLAIRVREALADGELARPDRLVPVPLHPRRLWQRGFNQAELIATALGRDIGVPLLAGTLRRVRNTPPQSGLGAASRRTNLRGAFRASPRVAGLRVALVDDVLTTGSTLASAARALDEAGALEVQRWAVARSQSKV